METEYDRFVDWANFLGIPSDKAFEIAIERLDHFGLEGMTHEDSRMEYLNTGDTYSATLILDGSELYCGCWGDWYEDKEQEYCLENNLIRCPHCGHYTECNEDWRTTICNCDYDFGS